MKTNPKNRMAQLRFDLGRAALASVKPMLRGPGGVMFTPCELDAVGVDLANAVLRTLAAACPDATGVALTTDGDGQFVDLEPIPWIDPDKERMLEGYEQAAGITRRIEAADMLGRVHVIGQAVPAGSLDPALDGQWLDLVAGWERLGLLPPDEIEHARTLVSRAHPEQPRDYFTAADRHEQRQAQAEAGRAPMSYAVAADRLYGVPHCALVDAVARGLGLDPAKVRDAITAIYDPEPAAAGLSAPDEQTNTAEDTNKQTGGPPCH
jgi:hypothetical protein